MVTFAESKSGENIHQRGNVSPQKKSPGFLIIMTIGIAGSIYFQMQFVFFGLILMIVSYTITAKYEEIGQEAYMPLYGLVPFFFRIIIDIAKCIWSGKPL